MKKIIFFATALLTLVACSKDEIGGTKMESMAGQWYCTVDAVDDNGNPITQTLDGSPNSGEDYWGVGRTLVLTYNTAANTPDEMWNNIMGIGNFAADNNYPLYPDYDFITKVKCDQATLTFSSNESANIAEPDIWSHEEEDAEGNPIVMSYSTSALDIILRFLSTPGIGFQWAKSRIQELAALPIRTEMENFQLQQLQAFYQELTPIGSLLLDAAVTLYNRLYEKYSFLEIPGYDYIDPIFVTKGITFDYALFKGNIAYFHVDKFAMTLYLEDACTQETFNTSDPATMHHIQQMREVWQAWFNTVQQLHRSGTLGGVVLDVRSNPGGNVDDFQYFAGSLLPSGSLHFGYQRYKRGTARYDYSPMMEATADTMSSPHETITEPVVILTNCKSVSMSEMSTLGVKTMPNGKVIGKRTWGGLCPLSDNEYNTYNYSGFIGEKGKTAVYGYVPMLGAFTLDKKLIEGEGITPDIEVDFDDTLFKNTGRDSQLERALQFITSDN
jgi:hypothetical protein